MVNFLTVTDFGEGDHADPKKQGSSGEWHEDNARLCC